MVNFSVFNELSLPFKDASGVENKFIEFIKLLSELNKKNLQKVRIEKPIQEYNVIDSISFQQFFGQITNMTLQDRLRIFLKNEVVQIESPLINNDEDGALADCIVNKYCYNGNETYGGLTSGYIWNTLVVSFNSHAHWNSHNVVIQKNSTNENVRHASLVPHLDSHGNFFDELEKELKLGITKENFWIRRNALFTKNIFCDEVEHQIEVLDRDIFERAISILRDAETDKKSLTDYAYSGESDSVKNDHELKKQRYFTSQGEKIYFDNHIKTSGHRIYFLEQSDKIYIGYIGKHLPTKNF